MGRKRSPESIAKQKATVARLTAEGKWHTQQPEFIEKLRGPKASKGQPGKRHWAWVPIGTRGRSSGGKYIRVKVGEPDVWDYEHRVIAAEKLGRRLEKGEIVHHLNGDKIDNRPENLVVMTASTHMSLKNHGHPRCPICAHKHPPHP